MIIILIKFCIFNNNYLNDLATIQQLFEVYYQDENDEILDDLFLTIKNSLITLKQQNNPNLIKEVLIYLASEIGCTDDLERYELVFDELLGKNILNKGELMPFWENLQLRQG